jgi:5-methylcytosine-specific restriction endonuclease McrA
MECKNCGKITHKFAGRYVKYCNYQCKIEYEKKISKKLFADISCAVCNNKFTPKSKVAKNCSPECKYKYELSLRSKKPKHKECSFCTKSYVPYTSLDKFCSADCRIKNKKSKRKFNWTPEQVEKRVGDKNPAYRNGMFSRGVKLNSSGMRLFQKNAKAIKQAMIELNGFVSCENCGITNPTYGFEAHHLVYRSEKPLHPNLHDKENIYILCKPCHNAYHKDKGMRNQLVISRGLNAIFGQDVLEK